MRGAGPGALDGALGSAWRDPPLAEGPGLARPSAGTAAGAGGPPLRETEPRARSAQAPRGPRLGSAAAAASPAAASAGPRCAGRRARCAPARPPRQTSSFLYFKLVGNGGFLSSWRAASLLGERLRGRLRPAWHRSASLRSDRSPARLRGAQSGACDLPAGCETSKFMVPFALPARCSGTAALFICWHFFAPETSHRAHSILLLFASNTHFGSVATGVQHDARARPHDNPGAGGLGEPAQSPRPGSASLRRRADPSTAAALPPPPSAAGGRMRSWGAQSLFALCSRCPPPTGGLAASHRLGADRLRGSERGALPFRPSVPAARVAARCCTTRFLFLSLRCAAGSGGECAGRRSPPWAGGTTRPVPPARSPPTAALARPRRLRGPAGGAPPLPALRPKGPLLSEGKGG